MITPSFGLTATERVLPRLALDFTTASLDPRVTFTRTGNTATVTNSSGLIAPINADLPRFDFDPITLACKGLLIEEARTNSLLYSSQFDNAAWSSKVRINTTGTPAWVDVEVSPDGTQNADKLIEDTTATNTHFIAKSAVGTFTNVSLSVYAKASERFKMALREDTSTGKYVSVNLQTGAILDSSASDASYTLTPSIVNVGNGWYRVSLAMATAVSSSRGIQIMLLPDSYTSGSPTTGASLYTGNGTSGLFIWGAQLEAGAFATSYIPTTTTALTRNADVATMTGTNFSSWYNASEGAFVNWYVLSDGYSTAQTPRVGLGVSDGTTSNRIRMYVSSATTVNVGIVSGGTTVASLDTTVSNITTTVNKTAVAYKLDSFASSSNGGTPVTDSAGAVPTVNVAYIGSIETGTTSQINGCVQKIFYWPQRLTNAELQAISK